jgi:MEDS: MEthanogen/methylotroph, DcmR Sensory domain
MLRRKEIMSEHLKVVRLAGREIERPCHACAFFHSREEEYRVLLPFAQEGFERGERGFHIVDARHRQERWRHLAQLGIDVAEAERQGLIEVRAWEEAHLREGRFDQYAMLELVDEVLTRGKTGGFGLTRFWANMEWALEEYPGVYDLVEYETRLNTLLPKFEDVVVCTYDLSRFSASVVINILRTHPMVIIGTVMQPNPFFVSPEEFLRELAEQAAPSSGPDVPSARV